MKPTRPSRPARNIAGRFVWPLLLGCLTGLTPAIAAAQLYATPITEPDKLYQLDGFSLTPPRGPAWFEMKREPRFVYFGKRLASPTHSFIAIAVSAPASETFDNVEAFRDFVARQLAEAGGDQRTKVELKAATVDTVTGPFCIRYQTSIEDRGAAYARGRNLATETVGVSCLHPDDKSLVIDLSYTERGLPAETGTVLRDEGETFIRSLRFTPRLRPPPVQLLPAPRAPAGR